MLVETEELNNIDAVVVSDGSGCPAGITSTAAYLSLTNQTRLLYETLLPTKVAVDQWLISASNVGSVYRAELEGLHLALRKIQIIQSKTKKRYPNFPEIKRIMWFVDNENCVKTYTKAYDEEGNEAFLNKRKKEMDLHLTIENLLRSMDISVTPVSILRGNNKVADWYAGVMRQLLISLIKNPEQFKRNKTNYMGPPKNSDAT